MLVKAKISFTGALTMTAGEQREIAEGATLSDLLHCGYVEPCEVKQSKPKKAVSGNEGKRTAKRRD